jgi:hypothetical protein
MYPATPARIYLAYLEMEILIHIEREWWQGCDCDIADRDLAVLELGLLMNSPELPSAWVEGTW